MPELRAAPPGRVADRDRRGVRGGLRPVGLDVPRDPFRRRDDPAVSPRGRPAPDGGHAALRLAAPAGHAVADLEDTGARRRRRGAAAARRQRPRDVGGAESPLGPGRAHRRVGPDLDDAARRARAAGAAARRGPGGARDGDRGHRVSRRARPVRGRRARGSVGRGRAADGRASLGDRVALFASARACRPRRCSRRRWR